MRRREDHFHTYSSLRACSNISARADNCETDGRLSDHPCRPDEIKIDIYQLFDLFSRRSHNLGVSGFTFFLHGIYKVLYWTEIMSALRRMSLTLHLIFEEGENAVKSTGEIAREEINDPLLWIRR